MDERHKKVTTLLPNLKSNCSNNACGKPHNHSWFWGLFFLLMVIRLCSLIFAVELMQHHTENGNCCSGLK